jgi:hypothetical protein
LGLVAVAWRPIELPCLEHLREASPPDSAPQAFALLVVDDATVRSAGAPSGAERGDASYAWWSALEEEFGPTAFLSPSTLRRDGIPAGAAVAVLSASAVADRRTLAALLAWAEAGHLLVVDAVEPSAAAALGVALREAAVDSTGLRLHAVDTELDSLELFEPAQALAQLPQRARPLIWGDGVPLAAAWPLGAGAVVACGFDLGRVQAQARQWRRLAASHERWLPRADLLLRAVLHGARDRFVLPRVSPLPAGVDGLYLLDFDADWLGDAAATLQAAAPQGASNSFFVPAVGLSPATLRDLQVAGADLTLSWDARSPRPRQRLGLGAWRPFWRELPLHAQLALWMRHNGGAAPACVRSIEAPADEQRHFRILAANEVPLDSSFGPQDRQFGWVYESARPYHPLDRNGRPFQLLELPFTFRSDERYHPHAEERLLRESQRLYRGIVVASFRAGAMREEPSVHRMRGLLEAGQRAARYAHPVWSFRDYLAFRRTRLASRITGRAGRFRVHLAGPNLALELPAVAGLDSVRLNGRWLTLPAAHPSGWHVLPLAPGEHTLELLGR